MKRLSVALALSCLAAPAWADDALHAGVLGLLSGYEDAPAAQDLRALGDGAGAELLAIATDPAESTTHRERATWALGWFPSETNRVWLTTTLGDATAASGMRRSAAWALVNGWGDAALPAVEAGLASDDTQLQAQCARALGHLGTPAARALLQARLATEPNAMVVTTIQTALGGK
jgi:HEAT repeat protein